MKEVCFLARNLKGGGVRRVIENLLCEFDKETNIEVTLLTDNENFLQRYKNIKVKLIKGNVLLWDNIYSFRYLLSHNFQTIIYPKGTIPVTHRLLKSQKLYIIHDLGYFVKELNAYKKLDTIYMNLLMKSSCNSANTIFAISNYTKQDIINRFGIDESKIVVAYEGVEEDFKKVKDKDRVDECLKKYEINKQYVFYAGSISPRKNILRTLQAFDKIKHLVQEDLVITGNNVWGKTGVSEYISKNLKGRVKVLGFIPKEDLITLYSAAHLYIYPSLYEGFGLPTLEAQACGCPVISSNVTSLPEVGGNSVEYFDPYDVKSISNTMLKVLKDNKLRKNLITLGYKNIQRFSWKKMKDVILKSVINEQS